MSKSASSTVASRGPLALEKLGELASLRQALEQAGFNAEAVARTMAPHAPGEGLNLPALCRKTEAPSDYHTLFRLFLLGQTVSVAAAERALKPMSLPALLQGGLLRAKPDGVRSMGRLVPFEHLYCLGDFTGAETVAPPRRTRVLGVNPSSVCLANLTVRRRGESVFDLGTGGGIQALLAAQHAGAVVGSDLNARALNFAAFNGRLNGLNNLQWHRGPFFEPVRGQQFDLVVANPPFVISPESALLYRDGGLPADQTSERVVREAGAHLKEGGFASVLLNWHHAGEEDWYERPWEWLAENGCDGWLLRLGDSDPLTYAVKWLPESYRQNRGRYARLLDQWLQYYQELGIRRIAFGLLTLRRRRAEENWFRCDTLPQLQGRSPCGEQIQRVFAGEDFLNRLPNEQALWDQPLAVATDLVLEQRLGPGPTGWAVKTMQMRFARGLPFAGEVDPAVFQLLAGCDGRRPLRAVLAALGAGPGAPAQAVGPQALEVARTLVRWGMLLPHGEAGQGAEQPYASQ